MWLCIYTLFIMHQTMLFVVEKRRVTACFEQKVLAELARHLRTRSFAGGHEKRPEALCFVKKIHAEHVFSVRKPMKRRQFHSKRQVCDAVNLSGISRRRDFANPLGVEPLSF